MKVLVTGGSGLLGTALIKGLLELGHSVTSFSRKTTPEAASPMLEVVHGDVTKLADLYKAAEGANAVIHCAAKTSIWGDYDEFYSVNVEGTRNVIRACLDRSISYLIYTSVWSVAFSNAHQQGVNEAAKLPEKFAAHYPATKAAAEQFIIKAHSRHLNTIALRPAAIWGPGENSFSSRIIALAKAGKLRMIGDGSNFVDFIYVDNCVNAHLLALGRITLSSASSGKSYFISDGRPVKMGEFLNHHLKLMKLAPLKGGVSPVVASVEAARNEWMHKLNKRSDPPELTRFGVLESSCTHWYDIKAARDELGYTPAITVEKGLEKFRSWYLTTEWKKDNPSQEVSQQKIVRADHGPRDPAAAAKSPDSRPPREIGEIVDPIHLKPIEKPDLSLKKAIEKHDKIMEKSSDRPDRMPGRPPEKAEKAKKEAPGKTEQPRPKPVDEKTMMEQMKQALDLEILHRDAISRICRGLSQSLEIHAILSEMLKSMAGIISFCSAGVFIHHRETEEIDCAATFGHYEDEMKRQMEDSGALPAIVIKKNEALAVKDIQQDPRFRSITATAGIRSALYCPISFEREVLGCLCLWNNKEEPFSSKEIDSVSFIAHEAARALKNADLYKKLNTKLHFIVTLWVTTKKLTDVGGLASQSRKTIIEQVLETIKVLFEVDGVIFFHYEAHGKILIPTVFAGIFTDIEIAEEETPDYDVEVLSEITPGEFIKVEFRDLLMNQGNIEAGNLLEKPFQISNLADSPKRHVFEHLAHAGNVQSLYWHPLIGREGPMGSLVFLSHSRREWSGEEVQWAEIFGNIFFMNLENIDLSEELHATKHHLHALAEAMPEGTFTTDLSLNMVTWSKSAERISGWTARDVIGKKCDAILGCQTQDGYSRCAEGCVIRNALGEEEREESGRAAIYILTRQGTRIPVSLNSSPLRGGRKKVLGVIGIFRHLSEAEQ